MAEEYSSPASQRRKISDPLGRLSDVSSGSSFNSIGGSNPSSPRLLPRRARQGYAPAVPNSSKSPILGGSNSTTASSSFSPAFQVKQMFRQSSNSSLVMDVEGDDFLSGIDSGVSGNYSNDSGQWERSFSPNRSSPRSAGTSRGKTEINWQEKCLGLQLELHRFKHQATQVKDILQDKVSFVFFTLNFAMICFASAPCCGFSFSSPILSRFVSHGRISSFSLYDFVILSAILGSFSWKWLFPRLTGAVTYHALYAFRKVWTIN